MDRLMWTSATRAQHNRDALRFATDLTWVRGHEAFTAVLGRLNQLI